MNFFKRKNRTEQAPETADAAVDVRRHATVEIEASKEASEEAFERARKANKQLNDLLVENGFTIKIFIAAGGQPPKKKRKKKTT